MSFRQALYANEKTPLHFMKQRPGDHLHKWHSGGWRWGGGAVLKTRVQPTWYESQSVENNVTAYYMYANLFEIFS